MQRGGQGDLLTWVPQRPSIERPGPHISTYGTDYQPSPSLPFKQKFISRPKTSFDEGHKVTTTYRYAHGKDNPNKDILVAINSSTVVPSHRKIRSFSAQTAGQSVRESVASCMTWHSATPRMLQLRTQVTNSMDVATLTAAPPPPKSAPAAVQPDTTS